MRESTVLYPLLHREIRSPYLTAFPRVCPALISNCGNDLNGTGQGYTYGGYAMMRWLLRSLMSAGETRSFFTGVGESTERRPFGLNKSDTKNTCGKDRKKHCRFLLSKIPVTI